MNGHKWARLDSLPTAQSEGWRCVRCGLRCLPYSLQPAWPLECRPENEKVSD